MTSCAIIQDLIAARLDRVREASEKRDVDELMSWYSKDARFSHVFNNISLQGWDAIHDFYAAGYKAMPTFKILDPKTTGFTPEFVACEMKCEGITAVDLPQAQLQAGETLRLTGVSLFWWRWEGPGENWDGSLSEEAVRGWKITEERAYFTEPKANSGWLGPRSLQSITRYDGFFARRSKVGERMDN